MQAQPHSDRDVDLALRRYGVVMRCLADMRQMTWTKTQFYLGLDLGLLTLTGALAKTPFIGTGWLASHAVRIVAGTGFTTSILWNIALRQDAREVNRCVEVCHALEQVAMEQHELLQDVRKTQLSTHRIVALLFFFIWLAVITTTQLTQ